MKYLPYADLILVNRNGSHAEISRTKGLCNFRHRQFECSFLHSFLADFLPQHTLSSRADAYNIAAHDLSQHESCQFILELRTPFWSWTSVTSCQGTVVVWFSSSGKTMPNRKSMSFWSSNVCTERSGSHWFLIFNKCIFVEFFSIFSIWNSVLFVQIWLYMRHKVQLGFQELSSFLFNFSDRIFKNSNWCYLVLLEILFSDDHS